MRTYETTFIINPQADDATLDKQVTSITDLIKSNGGNILCENRIGTRRLAYEIAGLSQGYYTQLFYEAPQDALPVLDRFFKLEDPFVRFMTVTFEGPVPSPEDLNRSVEDDRDDRNDRGRRNDRDDDDRGRRGSGRRDERSDDRPKETAKASEPAKEEAPKEEAPKAETSVETEKPAEPAASEAPAEKAEEPKSNPSDDDIL